VFQLLFGLAWVCAVLVASGFSHRVDLLRFPLAWAGVLVALDGFSRWRRGASPLRTAGDWVAASAASVLFWDVFELVNLRLRNWGYAGVSPDPWASSAFALVSFATVLPAARLGFAQLRDVEPRPAPEGRAWKAAAGLGLLAVALAFPRHAFPLAWIFLWPFCAALAGVAVPLRAMALGLPLGFVWEALNWRCARGWVYSIPFFDRAPKLFEMPLPGYLGYLPFALECAAALALLDRVRPHLRGSRGWLALLAIVALHVGADRISRGQTVLSFSR
jgi:hypothetical protein